MPDESTVHDGYLGNVKTQDSSDKCINEYTRILGPDAMPSLDVLKYGGLNALADHMHCLYCFEKQGVMGNECAEEAFYMSRVAENNLLDPNTTISFELNNERCDGFHVFEKAYPGASLGDYISYLVQLPAFWWDLSNVSGIDVNQLVTLWKDAPALATLRQLMKGSGWNGCRSERFRNREDRVNESADGSAPGTIRNFRLTSSLRVSMHVRTHTSVGK